MTTLLKIRLSLREYLNQNRERPEAVRLGADLICEIKEELQLTIKAFDMETDVAPDMVRTQARVSFDATIFGVRVIPSTCPGLIDWMTTADLRLWLEYRERFGKDGKQ